MEEETKETNNVLPFNKPTPEQALELSREDRARQFISAYKILCKNFDCKLVPMTIIVGEKLQSKLEIQFDE